MSETHNHEHFSPVYFIYNLILSTCSCFLTFQSSIKVRVGGHLEARMRQQETADVGEAGVDVLPYILQLFVLVLLHLNQQINIRRSK